MRALVDLQNAYYGFDRRQKDQSVGGGDGSSTRTNVVVFATKSSLPVRVVRIEQLICLHTVGSVKARPASLVQAAQTRNTRGSYWIYAGCYALGKHCGAFSKRASLTVRNATVVTVAAKDVASPHSAAHSLDGIVSRWLGRGQSTR